MVVARVRTEVEAAIVQSALEAEGVPSWVLGGMLTGFRAEAPVDAKVVVRPQDAELAREVLATMALEVEAGDRAASLDEGHDAPDEDDEPDGA